MGDRTRSPEEVLKEFLERVSSIEEQLGELRREISLHLRAREISEDSEIRRLADEGVRQHDSGRLASGPSDAGDWAEHFKGRDAQK
ncbi:MAG: hypothetical protein WD757_06920 [Actinomycetota bacterium]